MSHSYFAATLCHALQVETAAGINEGGRTGLTAVTIGVLFLCSVFLAPLFGTVSHRRGCRFSLSV